ncbi:MAG: hypothetical protein R2878_02510 [Thermoleophilia bacterium]
MRRLCDWRDQVTDVDWADRAKDVQRAGRPAVRFIDRRARPAVRAVASAAQSARSRFDDVELPSTGAIQERVPTESVQRAVRSGARRLGVRSSRRRPTLVRRVLAVSLALVAIAMIADILRRRREPEAPEPGEDAIDPALNGKARQPDADAVERAA